MILIIGGAFQGKLEYGCRMTGYEKEDFLDGARCGLEDIFTARGIRHFHEYLRRCLEEDPKFDASAFAGRLAKENLDLVIVTNEQGYGIVPAEPFDRLWRETVGRVCTRLASAAREVHRVVCGLGMVLKGSTSGCMEIFLIRHGKTAGNLEQRYIGSTDEELCETGIQELQRGSYPDAQVWLTSPMKRCRQTVALIAGKADPILVEDFRECDFGAFENKNYRELTGNPDYQAWIDSGGRMAFPGGESPEAFQNRSCQAFEAAVDRLLQMNCATAGLVVHGGTIMSVMERYVIPARGYYEWRAENGCGYRVRICPESWRRKKIAMLDGAIGEDKR